MIHYESFPKEHWQHKANNNSAECQARYQEYLKTDRWMLLKNTRFKHDHNECVLCGEPAQVAHHRRYPEVLGTETVDSLVSLCNRCHGNYHTPPSVTALRDQILAAANDDGADCPVCLRNVKFRRRRFNSSMALCATVCLSISRQKSVVDNGGWFHLIREFEARRKNSNNIEYSRLTLFGLIEKSETENGFYRLTELGEAFVENRASIPEWVVVYNHAAIAWAEDKVFITDVRGKDFDLDDIRASCGLSRFQVMKVVPKKAMPKAAVCV
jgi:hypothetical protein